ncbi:uncharacterized protein LOC117100884 [Anneissia japonica]|uniref:uncharacterized protein LOC117100884 n=1 Tax=Anneissia japonica TaxID=1529436 RepID=UPI0014254F3A|nr:uncharacterized protein LOC117100884 [Anneissia japonica]
MEFIKSNKGGRKLIHNGYLYIKRSSNKSSIYWQCSHKVKFACKALLTSDLDCAVVKSVSAHTHDPDSSEVKAEKARQQINADALRSRATPGQLVFDEMARQELDVRVKMTTACSLKRNINYKRRQKQPPVPQTLEDLIFEGEWRETYDQKPFLLCDMHEATDRVTIFATNDGLKNLCAADSWFMDGTFKSCL